MLRVFALLPILSVAAHTGAYRRRNAHVARLTILDCDTPCSALSSATSASDGSLTSVCTSTMVNNLAQCYDCEVKVAAITQEKGQANLDQFIAGCKAGGLPVDSVTISAANSNIGEADSSGGSSSSSDSSVPAGSGDAPATSPGPAPPTSPTTFATSPANSKVSPAPSKAPTSGAPPTPSGASVSSPPRKQAALSRRRPVTACSVSLQRLCFWFLEWLFENEAFSLFIYFLLKEEACGAERNYFAG
ncbi:hypothetical protein B0H13DRAFT_2336958 [Mycena leptocephala]|nr:hypothetical protein B0H13DRAFT_2336958 [Mycena leptocephala]